MIDFIRDTVRPTIISSIIPSINTHIDHYLKLAHQNYIIQYDENFKCMMKNPYGELMPISSLSTGQKKVIDMIIILAFIKTFITQIDFNIYFLDELIGNIDADLRDTMCGLLRDTLDNRDVMFLISHSPINQQYLDGVIKVTMHTGISNYDIQPLS
jgi:DNA repair exonuclease SbcCD ATPase subunit